MNTYTFHSYFPGDTYEELRNILWPPLPSDKKLNGEQAHTSKSISQKLHDKIWKSNAHTQKKIISSHNGPTAIRIENIFKRLFSLVGQERQKYLALFILATKEEDNQFHDKRRLSELFIRNLLRHRLTERGKDDRPFIESAFCPLPSLDKQVCTLKEMQQRAQELRANNHAVATQIVRAINDQDFRLTNDHKLNTEQYRLQIYRLAHLATPFDPMIKMQFTPMVIAPLPFTSEEGEDYIQDLILQRCTLFVSAHDPADNSHYNEPPVYLHSYVEEFAPKFLKQDLISTKLKTVSSQSSSSTRLTPTLKETTCLFSEKTCITHIHFMNWKDGTPCPDPTLLVYLLDRMATLNVDPTSPIAINCFGGVGRAAVIAICYYLRQKLLYLFKTESSIDKISLNIPQEVLYFRQFRPDVMFDPLHLPTLYTVVSLYYERFKGAQHVENAVSITNQVSMANLGSQFSQMTVSK